MGHAQETGKVIHCVQVELLELAPQALVWVIRCLLSAKNLFVLEVGEPLRAWDFAARSLDPLVKAP